MSLSGSTQHFWTTVQVFRRTTGPKATIPPSRHPGRRCACADRARARPSRRSRARSLGALPGEASRAGHPYSAAYDQNIAVLTLVSGARPRRKHTPDLVFAEAQRHHVPRLLAKSHPVDAYVDVDLYLPGCPPTPELFMAVLLGDPDFQASKIVCQECGRTKLRDMRPKQLVGFQQGRVLPDICLINQGYLCIGSSTRGGCRAPCPRAGHPCVGCRGPSDAFIEKDSEVWLRSIKRVFDSMTDIPEDEIDAAVRSPQLSLFLFQFSDYAGDNRIARPKEKVF